MPAKGLLLLLLLTALIACDRNKANDHPEDQAAILQLHHAQRDYHFNKDSIAFANQLSDNFISVNRGVISQPTKEETIARYHRYFSSVEFVRWDDVSEPIIKFSNDGNMAYTLVDKIVVVTYPNESGEEVQDTTHFAWTTIYRKYGDEWKIDCVTSTNKPTEQN